MRVTDADMVALGMLLGRCDAVHVFGPIAAVPGTDILGAPLVVSAFSSGLKLDLGESGASIAQACGCLLRKIDMREVGRRPAVAADQAAHHRTRIGHGGSR